MLSQCLINGTLPDHIKVGEWLEFTIHKDLARKEMYIKRHQKNEDWNNPMTAGALSRWILWNNPTLSESIADYKRRFGL